MAPSLNPLDWAEDAEEGIEKGGEAVAHKTSHAAQVVGGKTVDVVKDTYITSKDIGGRLSNVYQGLVSGSLPAWLGIPATIAIYAFAVSVGILLSVGSLVVSKGGDSLNSVELEQSVMIAGCELVSSPYESLACKCSRDICTNAYPDLCSDVQADPSACTAAQSFANKCDQLQMHDSDVTIDAKRNGNFLNVIVNDPSGDPDDLWYWDANGKEVDADSEFTTTYVKLNDQHLTSIGYISGGLGFEGRALPSSYSSSTAQVEIVGVVRNTYCVDPQGNILPDVSCQLDDQYDVQNKFQLSWVNDDKECTLYRTAIDSAPIALKPVGKMSASIWADDVTLYPGQCTTVHWSVQGSPSKIEFDDGTDYYTADAGLSGSRETCPDKTTQAGIRIVDANGVDQLEFVFLTVDTAYAPSEPQASSQEDQQQTGPGSEDNTCPPQIEVTVGTFCRQGPGKAFDAIGDLQPGELTEVKGLYADDNYYVVNNYGVGGSCWIWGGNAILHGNTSCLSYWSAPEPPVAQDEGDSNQSGGQEPSSSGGQTETLSFMLWNDSDRELCRLEMKSSDDTSWSPNLLSVSIGPAESYPISVTTHGSPYDMKFQDCDGHQFVYSSMNIKDNYAFDE